MSFLKLFSPMSDVRVADLLDYDHASWSENPLNEKPYYVEHANGLKLWVANSFWGISTYEHSFSEVNGVTLLSSFGFSPGHWLLWLAYRRWRKRHPWKEKIVYSPLQKYLFPKRKIR